MKKIYLLLFTLLISIASIGQTTVFINEIHYDNGNGSDVNEGFEIAGPVGTDLTGWTVAKYNGSSTQLSVYGTEALSGMISDQQGGYGTLWFGLPSNGLQNGSPDGLALVAADGTTVIQFLSYEGSFTAADGPAMGMTSVDIGVAESGITLGTESLQLQGSGTEYENFTWASPAASTNGAVNNNQTFGAPVPTVSITSPADFAVIPSGTTSVDIVFSTTNTMAGDTVDITVTIDGGTPTTTNDVASPFTITPTADGEMYEVTAELIRAASQIDFETIDFSIAYPCDLQLGTITTTCDATTSNEDTYTTTIDYTGGATSTYMMNTGGMGSISGDDPSVTASGTIIITGVNEEVDFTLNITGDVANSSCNIMQLVNGPTCVPTVCANPGDIVITEVMRNPSAVSDSNGEYFEVYNASAGTIDMQGWVIKDDASPTETHTIASSVSIASGGYAVFVINGNMATNGGITASYSYNGDISLGNSGTDGIIIECASTVIDQVIWDGTFPSATAGVSMELTTSVLARNNTDNDIGTNWGAAVTAYGDGDLGTPGAANDFTLSNDDFSANRFSVYPNPTATGFVNIKTNSGDVINVQVFDVLGKSVISQSIHNEKLDVSSLKTGIYIMRISQNNNSATKKLVIK